MKNEFISNQYDNQLIIKRIFFKITLFKFKSLNSQRAWELENSIIERSGCEFIACFGGGKGLIKFEGIFNAKSIYFFWSLFLHT